MKGDLKGGGVRYLVLFLTSPVARRNSDATGAILKILFKEDAG